MKVSPNTTGGIDHEHEIQIRQTSCAYIMCPVDGDVMGNGKEHAH